jgi:hypothetical protein
MSHYHPIPFIFNGVDESTKFFERSSNDDLIIRLAVANTLELEAHQTCGETALRPRQGCYRAIKKGKMELKARSFITLLLKPIFGSPHFIFFPKNLHLQ